MRFSRAWPNFPGRDVEDIHYAHDVVFSIAASLEICEQLVLQNLVHVVGEERGMDADLSLEIA